MYLISTVLIWYQVFFMIYANYNVPDAYVEITHPKGFKVSIPDEEGIKLFAFHGKVNEPLNGREGGIFSRDILCPENGRWTFVDTTTKLKAGDTLYFWTYVDYDDGERKLGYVKDDQSFTVKERAVNFEIPDVLVEPLHPKGFKLSIPDEEGIRLFAFHGKINEEFNGREAGVFSRDIVRHKNGRWTFVDHNTKINPGDVLYYWIFVEHFDGVRSLGYVKYDLSFTF